MRGGPPQFCPPSLPSRDPSAQPGSGQRAEVLRGRVLAPAGRGRMEDSMSRPWKGSLRQGMELGPSLPKAELIRVRDLPSLGIAWPGHGSGIRHLGPGVICQETQHSWAPAPNFQQLQASEQGFWRRNRVSRAEQQGGYFRGDGSAAEGSPTNRGERLGGGRRGQGGRVGRRGQSQDGQRGRRSRRKGERVWKLGPESPSLAGCCKALLLIGLSGADLAHLAAIQVGWQEKPVFQ